MKTVIVYYSLDGNTKHAAETLAKAVGADVCEIQPVKPIKSAGKPTFHVLMQGGGQVTFGLCPKIKEFALDLAAYDRIILGTPVWAGKPASFVRTFAKKYAPQNGLADKVTAVFTLSASGDNAGCVTDLQKLLPNIGVSVSLADKSNSLSADNERKLTEFAQQLMR
ncbi:MAG: NAD(P)H-dependent oxidoreductase [Clostridia bacterium]|nr:NAD(P)H-dependent oxidoreductase [Clostridia bacterium]